jgi:hypothetical protein
MQTLKSFAQVVNRELNALVDDSEVYAYTLRAIGDHASRDWGFNRKEFKFHTVADQAIYPFGSRMEPDGFGVPRIRKVFGQLWLTSADGGTTRPLPPITDDFRRALDALGGSIDLTAETCGLNGYSLEAEGLVIAPPPGEDDSLVQGRAVVVLPLPEPRWTGSAWEFFVNGERVDPGHVESPWFEWGADPTDGPGNLIAAYAANLVARHVLGNTAQADAFLGTYAQRLAERTVAQSEARPSPALANIFEDL